MDVNIINDIITKYENGYSILQLCSEYKVGKKKIKTTLTNNNMEIRKKGGQQKHKIIDFDLTFLDNKNVRCNCCQKSFNDPHNKNGALIIHLSSCQPHIEIPSKFKRSMFLKTTGNYWHMQYFSVEDKQEKELFNCPQCEWTTTDITNKTGAITKHVEKAHGTIYEFVNQNENLKHLFDKHIIVAEKELMFENDEKSYVTCQICNQKMIYITETHLTKHNINLETYKSLYPNNPVTSDNFRETMLLNIQNSDADVQYRSKGEIELFEFIQTFDSEVIPCDKKLLNGVELDILSMKYNIAFEYNGLFWHSEKQGKGKNYHLDKSKMCARKGIRLIHIFSDEWETKKDIIKNRIRHIFGLSETRIFARKCEVREVSKKEKSEFLNSHHLQGNDKSKIAYGLIYEKKLVSIATFGQLRLNMGNKNSDPSIWELYRFCGKNVVGGFSKLLKYFIKTNNPNKIITYSDKNWTPSPEDSFYGKVGFNFVAHTKPNYHYMLKYKKRENRFNYRKSILVKNGFDVNKTEREIMLENGYDIIWDCGNLKFEMVINNKGA
jgi:uncharacterized C2H2 Zn-finger protein